MDTTGDRRAHNLRREAIASINALHGIDLGPGGFDTDYRR
jgi:hypothetical protein